MRQSRFAVIAALFVLTALPASGQGERPWEQLMAEVMTADDMESADWEDTYDLLSELEQQPVDLNTASREQLEALPFLSDRQVEAIMDYRYHYGRLKSMSELRMIRALDVQQIELLRYFATVGDEPTEPQGPRLADIWKHGRHELMGYARIPLYKRRGDENGYMGYPYRHWLRYQMSYGDRVKAGFVGSQDAGEPFFSGRNGAGYDFYSFYVQARRLGPVDNIVAGRYKLSAGMGLVLNNSFGLGKLAMLQQLGRGTNGVRPHSSRSQSGYFQGVAATVSLSPRWQLTAFASYRPLDATLNADSTMSTIVADGYHRTPTEMNKKHNSHSADAGAHIGYRRGALHAGVTALYTHLDRRLQPDTATLYRRYSAQGTDFVNVSADYGYRHPRFALSGETAINGDGALATTNSLTLEAADGLTVMLLQRFFSYRYTALYARTMTEGGHVQNESGAYLGATWRPRPGLLLQAYTDYAYFAWARYGASQPSRAWDNLLAATYSHDSWTVAARYRLHLRQRDNETKTALDDYTEHRGRLSLTTGGPRLTATLQADATATGSDWGYMLSATAGRQWQRLKAGAAGGYFRTTGYAGRIYVYERGLQYTFSFPAFYGEGMRLMLTAQAKPTARLSLTAKLGLTHYFDRSTIGTGLQTIDGSWQSEVDVQVRWKF